MHLQSLQIILSCHTEAHWDSRTCRSRALRGARAAAKRGLPRIYMISTGFMVIASNMLQSHLLSTTTMKRLLLGICWITKDLPITAKDDKKTAGDGERLVRV